MRNKMTFSNKERSKSTLDSLIKALSNRDNSTINPGTVYAPQDGTSSDDNLAGGISDFATNGFKLGKTLWDNYKGSGVETVPEQYKFLSNSSFGSTPSDGTLFGGYDLGGANAGAGALGTSEMPTFSGFGGAETAGAEAAGGSFLGNVAPYGGIIMGGLRAGQKGLSGGDIKTDVPQAFFGVNEDDSDVMQGINGAVNGAIMGMPFGGPIGAAIGGILGLGSSFLDDI